MDKLDVFRQIGVVVENFVASLTLKLLWPTVVVEFVKVTCKFVLVRESLVAVLARVIVSLAAEPVSGHLVPPQGVLSIESFVANAAMAVRVKASVVALQTLVVGQGFVARVAHGCDLRRRLAVLISVVQEKSGQIMESFLTPVAADLGRYT